MASFNKFNSFVEALAEKAHNLGVDTLRMYLTDTAPSASLDLLRADLPTEVSNGNGYTTNGPAVTITTSAQTAGTYKLVLADLTITASGGSIGPFRYFVLYNDSAASDELIGYWDYGSSITLADGESVTVDFNPSNGAIQIA